MRELITVSDATTGETITREMTLEEEKNLAIARQEPGPVVEKNENS